MHDRSLSVRQAADSAARDPSTIRRWIKEGKLRGSKVGSRYEVDAADLDRLLQVDLLPLPPEWGTTSTGETMPNWVATVRRSRAERSREIQTAVKRGDRAINRRRSPRASASGPPTTVDGKRYGMIPGWELVSAGLSDLYAGRESVESLLLVAAAERLRMVGIVLPGEWREDAQARLYGLIVDRVGEGQAHSRYNALRRRLSSFLRAAQYHHAPGN